MIQVNAEFGRPPLTQIVVLDTIEFFRVQMAIQHISLMLTASQMNSNGTVSTPFILLLLLDNTWVVIQIIHGIMVQNMLHWTI